jgi:DNA mismatch repair protein MutS2
MNESFEEKTGFVLVRDEITGLCFSETGRSFVRNMQIMFSPEEITAEMQRTEEFRQILLGTQNFPSSDYFDLLPELSRLQTDGSIIEQELLWHFSLSYQTIGEIIFFLKTGRLQYPSLFALTLEIEYLTGIREMAGKLVDDTGEIRDHASAELKQIRDELKSATVSVERRLRQILSDARKKGIVDEHSELTVKNGRTVIPVPASYKRSIEGYVHDESASGQTVYIEPAEIFHMNNRIRDLELEEKREIRRLLSEFTLRLRPHLNQLSAAYLFLGRIDFTAAKARFCLTYGCNVPLISDQAFLEWHAVINPVLKKRLDSRKKLAVPLSVSLGKNFRILVISGPNAGGKSVCLKTAGMIQYMTQCGIPIPAAPGAESGIFRHFFIDIGDEQSIDNDLSTYSARLKNLSQLIAEADKDTLFLIDEFGSGTDPELGEALAMAALKHIHAQGACGIVTTHYPGLKKLAANTPGMENGAMLFDERTLSPLFRLRTGLPGSSFTFEMAEKSGLPPAITDEARDLAGREKVTMEQLISKIEDEKRETEQKLKEVQMADEFLGEVVEKYNQLHDNLKREKKQILEDAKAEALRIIKNANSLVEKAIKDIKEAKADRVLTKKIREELSDTATALAATEIPEKEVTPFIAPPKKEVKEKTFSIASGPLKAGDYVVLKGKSTPMLVEEIRQGKALILAGNIRMEFPLNGLDKVNINAIRKQKSGVPSSVSERLLHSASNFTPSADFRGMRAEEVLAALEKFLDDAVLSGTHEVRILHGKGWGILRRVVRDYLKKYPGIISFSDEHVERGGDGITIVRLG